MIGGIGTCCSQSFLKLENRKDPRVSLVDLWGQVITLRGQILVSRTDDDPRVYVQNVPVHAGTTRTVSSVPHHTPHRTYTPRPQDTTHHNSNDTTTSHGDRDRETEKEDRE